MSHMREKIDPSVLQALSQKGIKHWMFDASADWFVMAAVIAAACYWTNVATVFLAVAVLGNRQHALALLGHDGTHYTLSAHKGFNDLLTNFFAFWPLGLTTSGYRALHYRHHKHTGQDEDPELAHKRSRSPQWDLPAKPLTILKYAALDFIGNSVPDYIIIVTYSKPECRRSYIPLVLVHCAFAAGFMVVGLWLVPILWYISLSTTFMMFFRLRLWLEHQGTSETHRLHLNRLEAALLAPHYGWMHWEHHNWPGIPYHRLPALRKYATQAPIITLKELLGLFATSAPSHSGEVLRKT